MFEKIRPQSPQMPDSNRGVIKNHPEEFSEAKKILENGGVEALKDVLDKMRKEIAGLVENKRKNGDKSGYFKRHYELSTKIHVYEAILNARIESMSNEEPKPDHRDPTRLLDRKSARSTSSGPITPEHAAPVPKEKQRLTPEQEKLLTPLKKRLRVLNMELGKSRKQISGLKEGDKGYAGISEKIKTLEEEKRGLEENINRINSNQDPEVKIIKGEIEGEGDDSGLILTPGQLDDESEKIGQPLNLNKVDEGVEESGILSNKLTELSSTESLEKELKDIDTQIRGLSGLIAAGGSHVEGYKEELKELEQVKLSIQAKIDKNRGEAVVDGEEQDVGAVVTGIEEALRETEPQHEESTGVENETEEKEKKPIDIQIDEQRAILDGMIEKRSKGEVVFTDEMLKKAEERLVMLENIKKEDKDRFEPVLKERKKAKVKQKPSPEPVPVPQPVERTEAKKTKEVSEGGLRKEIEKWKKIRQNALKKDDDRAYTEANSKVVELENLLDGKKEKPKVEKNPNLTEDEEIEGTLEAGERDRREFTQQRLEEQVEGDNTESSVESDSGSKGEILNEDQAESLRRTFIKDVEESKESEKSKIEDIKDDLEWLKEQDKRNESIRNSFGVKDRTTKAEGSKPVDKFNQRIIDTLASGTAGDRRGLMKRGFFRDSWNDIKIKGFWRALGDDFKAMFRGEGVVWLESKDEDYDSYVLAERAEEEKNRKEDERTKKEKENIEREREIYQKNREAFVKGRMEGFSSKKKEGKLKSLFASVKKGLVDFKVDIADTFFSRDNSSDVSPSMFEHSDYVGPDVDMKERFGDKYGVNYFMDWLKGRIEKFKKSSEKEKKADNILLKNLENLGIVGNLDKYSDMITMSIDELSGQVDGMKDMSVAQLEEIIRENSSTAESRVFIEDVQRDEDRERRILETLKAAYLTYKATEQLSRRKGYKISNEDFTKIKSKSPRSGFKKFLDKIGGRWLRS